MARSGNLTITRHRISVTGNCTMKWGRCKRPENRPYVESEVRPHKAGLDRDFSSDLLDKPVDAAYGHTPTASRKSNINMVRLRQSARKSCV